MDSRLCFVSEELVLSYPYDSRYYSNNKVKVETQSGLDCRIPLVKCNLPFERYWQSI